MYAHLADPPPTITSERPELAAPAGRRHLDRDGGLPVRALLVGDADDRGLRGCAGGRRTGCRVHSRSGRDAPGAGSPRGRPARDRGQRDQPGRDQDGADTRAADGGQRDSASALRGSRGPADEAAADASPADAFSRDRDQRGPAGSGRPVGGIGRPRSGRRPSPGAPFRPPRPRLRPAPSPWFHSRLPALTRSARSFRGSGSSLRHSSSRSRPAATSSATAGRRARAPGLARSPCRTPRSTPRPAGTQMRRRRFRPAASAGGRDVSRGLERDGRWALRDLKYPWLLPNGVIGHEVAQAKTSYNQRPRHRQDRPAPGLADVRGQFLLVRQLASTRSSTSRRERARRRWRCATRRRDPSATSSTARRPRAASRSPARNSTHLLPSKTYASGLDSALSALSKTKSVPYQTLKSAKTPSAQAKAARQIATAYSVVATDVKKLKPTPYAQPENQKIYKAMVTAAGTWRTLGWPPPPRARRGYSAASKKVASAEARLSSALSELKNLGYSVGSTTIGRHVRDRQQPA